MKGTCLSAPPRGIRAIFARRTVPSILQALEDSPVREQGYVPTAGLEPATPSTRRGGPTE